MKIQINEIENENENETEETIKKETIRIFFSHDSKYIKNTTIKQFIENVEDKYQEKIVVKAILRHSKARINRDDQLEDVKIKKGDVIVAVTTPEYIEILKKEKGIEILEDSESHHRKEKALPALAILLFVILTAASGIIDILVATLSGVVAMIIFGVLDVKEAYKKIEWDVIFMLAGLLSLGTAFNVTGASALLAKIITLTVGNLNVIWVMILLYIFTTLITEVLSNNAAVILLTPIVIALALESGVHHLLYVYPVMFAASTAFLTPIGYQTNTMIFSHGLYKFTDFFKTGIILNIILAIVTPIAIYYFVTNTFPVFF